MVSRVLNLTAHLIESVEGKDGYGGTEYYDVPAIFCNGVEVWRAEPGIYFDRWGDGSSIEDVCIEAVKKLFESIS